MPLFKTMTIMALLVTISFRRVMVTEAAKALYAGQAHFFAAGEIASPVSYKTLGVEIKIPRYEEQAKEITKEIKEYFQKVEEDLTEKFNASEARKVVERISGRVSPQVLRLEAGAENLLRFYGATAMEKRSATLFFGAVSAVMGSIMAVGSSLMAHNEINNMAKEVRRIRKHENKMRGDMTKLGEGMKIIKGRSYEYHLEDQIVANLTLMLEPRILEFQEVLDGLYALKQHQLHPGLLPPEVLLEMQEELKRYKDGEWHPIFSLKNELMSLPLSFIQGTRSLLIMIHVPTVSDSKSMMRKLYRLDSAVVESEDQLVRLISPRPYISVDKAWNIHQTMSNDDLASCHVIGKIHLCSDDNILLKKAIDCTSALFFGLTNLAVETCEAALVAEDMPAVQVNDTTYAIKPAVITTRCPGEEPKALTLSRVTRVQVNPECTVEGELFTIAPRSPTVTPKVIAHRVLLPEVIVVNPPPTAKEVGAPDINLDLFLNDFTGAGAGTDDDYEEEEEKRLNWNSWWSAFLLGVLSFLSLVIITALSWACWRLGHKRGLKRQQMRRMNIEGEAGLRRADAKEPKSRQRKVDNRQAGEGVVRADDGGFGSDGSSESDVADMGDGTGAGAESIIGRRPPESVADTAATRRKKKKHHSLQQQDDDEE